MLPYGIAMVLCAFLLVAAAKIVSTQVINIAKRLSVPPFFIASLLVAASTSIPELFVGVTSALAGAPQFSLGDIIGSNIVNLTFIAGMVILLGRRRIQLSEHISQSRLLLTFAIASVPIFLCFIFGGLSREMGIFLLALYGVYIFFLVRNHPREALRPDDPKITLNKSIGFFCIGVVLLFAASQGIIFTAGALSTAFNIAPFIIGVFAIAFSTSLPELAFGIRVALERKPELSLADVIGSSAVNATGILGLVAIIHPITLSGQALYLSGSFYLAVFIAFYFLLARREVSPVRGALLLVVYLLFVSYNFLL